MAHREDRRFGVSAWITLVIILVYAIPRHSASIIFGIRGFFFKVQDQRLSKRVKVAYNG